MESEKKSPQPVHKYRGNNPSNYGGKGAFAKRSIAFCIFLNYFVKTYTIIFYICELKEKYFTILVRKPNKLIKLLLSFSKIPSVLWLPWKHYFLFALGGVRTAFLAALTVSIQVLYSRIP